MVRACAAVQLWLCRGSLVVQPQTSINWLDIRHLPVSQGERGGHKNAQTKALWLSDGAGPWVQGWQGGCCALTAPCTHPCPAMASASKFVRILSLHNPWRIFEGCLYFLWHSTVNQERDIWSVCTVWWNFILETNQGSRMLEFSLSQVFLGGSNTLWGLSSTFSKMAY